MLLALLLQGVSSDSTVYPGNVANVGLWPSRDGKPCAMAKNLQGHWGTGLSWLQQGCLFII